MTIPMNHLSTEILRELFQSRLVFTNEWKCFEESFDRCNVSRANGRIKSVVDDVFQLGLCLMQQLE